MLNIHRFSHNRRDLGDTGRFPPLRGGKLTRYLGFESPLLLRTAFCYRLDVALELRVVPRRPFIGEGHDPLRDTSRKEILRPWPQ